MDDDTNSAIQSVLEQIEDLKTRIAALEDEARTTADGAGDKASAAASDVDAKVGAAVEPVATRVDHIEQYLSGVLAAQVAQGAVSFAP